MVERRPMVQLEWINTIDSSSAIAAAHEALRESTSGYPFIAGGCLRDEYFGVEIKDIDCYVGPDFKPGLLEIALGPDWDVDIDIPADRISDYRGYFGEIITEVYKSRNTCDDDALPLQIMVWNREPDMAALLASMDFGFCQIGYDGRKTWTTRAFRQDAQANTATYTLRSDDPRAPGCYGRMWRLKEKYPDRKWIWPADIDFSEERFDDFSKDGVARRAARYGKAREGF